MKRLFFPILLFAGLNSFSQVEIPQEVARGLQGNKKFSAYAGKMMNYIQGKQSQFADGSPERKYFEKQEKFLARQLWYLEGRQEPNGDIANYSLKNYEAIRQYESDNSHRITATAYGVWSAVGPVNMTTSANNQHTGIGRVDRFAFHPTDPNIIFAGTPCGGIFKTINGGNTWTNLNAYIPSLGVSGIVVSWANPNIIYALTGDGDSNLGDNGFVEGFDYIRPSIGVIKSTDGGVSWQQTGSFGIDGFYVGFKLAQNPLNANILLAATSKGLYRTVNGGSTWNLVSPDLSTFYDIEWKSGSSTEVFAATNDSVFYSSDAGASLTLINDRFDFPIGNSSRIAIAVTPASPQYIYVFAVLNFENTVANKGVYRSVDGGANFTRRTNNSLMANGSPQYDHCLAVAPDNANIVVAGTLDVWRSINGASAFTQTNQRSDATQPDYAHDDVHDVAYNPLDNSLYVGTDGGVYKSLDDGLTFSAKYFGMNASQYYHFDVSTLDENYMFAGAQDNGGQYRPGPVSTFEHVIKGDGFDVRFYNNSINQAYVSVNKSLLRSDPGMANWTTMPVINLAWYKTIAMSYSNNNIVLSGSNPVYRTTNGGIDWSALQANGRWALTASPSNGSRFYAAGGANWNDIVPQASVRLERTDDLGDNWIALQDNPGLPDSITKITGIALDPASSARLWITIGGYAPGQKVYYSNNAGASWQNLSGTIPNIPVNCIAIDDNLDAYIGTDIGVFFKSALTPDWQPFYNNLPKIPVTELHIRNGTLYASTFGRGIWRTDTHGGCPALLNFINDISGVRFYEALTMTATGAVTGGLGTEIILRAQNYIDFNVGFVANGATGEKFRALIGDCNSGGFPAFRNGEINAWLSAQGRNNSSTLITCTDTENGPEITIDMPFDGKAGILLFDEKDQLKAVLLKNKMLLKGKTLVRLEKNTDLSNCKLVFLADGEIAGVITR